jgi:hypothetical protein
MLGHLLMAISPSRRQDRELPDNLVIKHSDIDCSRFSGSMRQTV